MTFGARHNVGKVNRTDRAGLFGVEFLKGLNSVLCVCVSMEEVRGGRNEERVNG